MYIEYQLWVQKDGKDRPEWYLHHFYDSKNDAIDAAYKIAVWLDFKVVQVIVSER